MPNRNRRKMYAVWYYGRVIRGPFPQRRLAQKAIAKIKETASCDYKSLTIMDYDSAFDVQDRTGHWTHPSVLALLPVPR